MEAIKFTLSGSFAFFKKPDVNVKTYFTYNNIHKVALLGLLGAVLGLQGYNNSSFKADKKEYPQFYQKLSNLKIAIIPKGRNGYFSKTIQQYNNSVGYASGEQSNILQVTEQWLVNPAWDIILYNNPENPIQPELWQQLKNNLLNNHASYLPYLGKNDFPAQISNVKVVGLQPPANLNEVEIRSLLPYEGRADQLSLSKINGFLFLETLPIALAKNYNYYNYCQFVFTNAKVDVSNNANATFFQLDGRVYAFI